MPIGVNTVIEGDTLTLTGMVASLDGKRLIRDACSDPCQIQRLGVKLAAELKSRGAGDILQEIFATVRPEA